jgi:hypothetical protein
LLAVRTFRVSASRRSDVDVLAQSLTTAEAKSDNNLPYFSLKNQSQ